MNRLYDDLAEWWPLFSPPADYADEAEYFLPLIAREMGERPLTFLELGSGGGNNASHMKKAFSSVTLVDVAPRMLEISRQLNPDCDHRLGDMRSVRLQQTFDVVFVHDAVDYMISESDLRAAIETAYIHCAPGGLAVFAPDHVAENFKPYTEHGGEDGDGRAIRYLEWTYDPDPTDTTCMSEFVILLREGNQNTILEHDRHTWGLFGRDVWLRHFAEAGFNTRWEVDPFERCIFVARRPG